MATAIRADHPLRHFFADLVERHLVRAAQLNDRQIARYLSDLLVDFTHVDRLYQLRTARGKRLEEVGEMLLASDPLLEASSFDQERLIRRYAGDYTLFLTGLFPEYVARLPRAGRVDSFIDYIQAGKQSYAVVAAFDVGEYRSEAPLFRRLSDRFELCVFGLNRAKDELAARQRGHWQQMRQTLELG